MALEKVGQVFSDEAEAVVIGGMVLDINATPSVVANPRTTTPGKVLFALGGVARNIAECMSKLGAKPFMISAVGFDLAGSLLLQPWRSAGLSEEGVQRKQDVKTPVVCHIFDGKGEVAAGVASVEAIEKFLTPEWIQNFKFKIRCAPILMVDANLSPPALVASCRMAAEHQTRVWFEPVSVAKSKKVAFIVKYITFTSPNEDELVAMANALSGGAKFIPIQKGSGNVKLSTESLFHMLKPAIWVLLEKGIRVVIVTLGPDGVFLCFKAIYGVENCDYMKNKPSSFSRKLYEAINSSCPLRRILGAPQSKGSCYVAIHFPARSASVVRLTGAGDCLVGGTIASICAGLDIMQSVAVGVAAAKGAVETDSNVPAEYGLTKISDDASFVYSNAKVVFCESRSHRVLPGAVLLQISECARSFRMLLKNDFLIARVQTNRVKRQRSLSTSSFLVSEILRPDYHKMTESSIWNSSNGGPFMLEMAMAFVLSNWMGIVCPFFRAT